MHTLYADLTVSITELKKNPSALLKAAQGQPIAVLNHNTPEAYLVPAKTFEAMMVALEEIELAEWATKGMKERDQAISVDVDAL